MTDIKPESPEPQPDETKHETNAEAADHVTDGASSAVETAGGSTGNDNNAETNPSETNKSADQEPKSDAVQPTAEQQQIAAAIHPVANGAGWLVWVAGCTLLNGLCVIFKMEFGLALGLVGPLALGMIVGKVFGLDDVGTGISIMIPTLISAGFFYLLFMLAQRFHTWAFIVGVLFIAIDLLLNLMTSDWISTAIHGWAIFALIAGAGACMAFNKQRKLMEATLTVPNT